MIVSQKFSKFMNSKLLNNTLFNKRTTSYLSGLQEHQFDYFIKRAEMIENKSRYSMNDIIYISICDGFKNIGLNWVEIKEVYNKVFQSSEAFRNLDFININTLTIKIDDKISEYSYTTKNDIERKYLDRLGIPESLVDETDISEKIFTIKSIFIQSKYKHNIYMVYVYRIIDEIIKKSKELDLKVDVEQIFKSA